MTAGTPAPAPSPGQPALEATPAPAAKAVSDERERRVEVDTPEASLAFSNRGARLVSWRLKRFLDAERRPEEMVQTLREGPRALDLETGDATVDARLREVLYVPSTDALKVVAGQDAEIRFDFAGEGLEVSRTLHFRKDGGLIGVSAAVRRDGKDLPVRMLWGPGLGIPTVADTEVQGYQPPQSIVLAGSVERHPAKVGPEASVDGAHWAGVESNYFAAILLPATGTSRALLRSVTLPHREDAKDKTEPVAVLELPGGEGQLYVGPKDYHALKRLGHGLEGVVPVGTWLGPITVLLMGLLTWVHGYVGNWGWTIVSLTILISLVLAPLRHYSIANGLRMAKLSPEMKVIQERYRKIPALDPRRQQMQEEIAALYARHGMSMSTQMLVGCLPLLLTMPFFFAFYNVLKFSIELRGADFLWISDLSRKDPLFLTPVLFGLSMLLTQRMTPTTMDPAQQRIMMIMPVVLTVMFFFAPSGLILYWLTSNLCSIVQQFFTMRVLGHSPARQERS
jgi:YidC/Oxa1 family membrane protein insertase